MPGKRDRPKVPHFDTEGEEAQWWDNHQDKVEEQLMAAIEDGTAHIGGPDLERAKRQAGEKGLPYQTYVKMLLHQALDREEHRHR